MEKFKLHLKNFENSEQELFKEKVNILRNLIRDPKGAEKVIDVLDHNDKDPVRSYYEGAVKFCERITQEMKNNNVSLVENTYIPKSEEEEEELKLSAKTSAPKEVKKTNEKTSSTKEEEKVIPPPIHKKEESDETRKPRHPTHP
jgi:preprotein translocase subunit SecA